VPDLESPLTTARNALWLAIDNWRETVEAFHKKWTFNRTDKSLKRPGPGLGDLPAIAIWTESFDQEWFNNIETKWPVQYRITIWTRDWELSEAEDLLHRVWRALYLAKPEGSNVEYLKAACGGLIPMPGPVTFRRAYISDAAIESVGKDDRTPVTVTDFTVVLKTRQSPFDED
jgi:hypothetical protein